MKISNDGTSYTRDDTVDTTLNKMLLGDDYHDEVTGVGTGYTIGTCRVTLGAACKHLLILASGDDDIVYCVMDSTSPEADLTGSTTNRYKLKASTTGTRTSLSFAEGVTTLDFLKKTDDGDSVDVYVDGFV